jgi:hypothetical protein
MCDCLTCGAFSACGNPGCTNDECPDCAEAREEREAGGRFVPRKSYADLPEPQPSTYRPEPEVVESFKRAILAGHTAAEAVKIAGGAS